MPTATGRTTHGPQRFSQSRRVSSPLQSWSLRSSQVTSYFTSVSRVSHLPGNCLRVWCRTPRQCRKRTVPMTTGRLVTLAITT
uniref:Uncharacterized protein n=1 Tax=Lepeophtheirus salmonis TaxID=72036 RepID=A0A0K2TW37_LEPSM